MKETESALQYFSRAFSEITNECNLPLGKLLQPGINNLAKYIISQKVIHLSKYAKKKRTRKKNQHRIQKEYKNFFELLVR